MKFKTGNLVIIKNISVEHLKQYQDMCGEIISWIKKKGEIKYKVRICCAKGWGTVYFKENELELLENMKKQNKKGVPNE